MASPRATVLYIHGNGGNIANVCYALGQLHSQRLQVLAFDWRGYGKSDVASWSEKAVGYDAEAAWHYLVDEQGIDPKTVIIWGHSLGGGIAGGLATSHPPAALVLESTFTSLPDVGASVYPWLPVRLLSSYRFPTLKRLDTIACPVVVAHARNDEVIPYELGRRLFQAAHEPKVFLELTGGHNLGIDGTPGALEKLVRFLEVHGALR